MSQGLESFPLRPDFYEVRDIAGLEEVLSTPIPQEATLTSKTNLSLYQDGRRRVSQSDYGFSSGSDRSSSVSPTNQPESGFCSPTHLAQATEHTKDIGLGMGAAESVAISWGKPAFNPDFVKNKAKLDVPKVVPCYKVKKSEGSSDGSFEKPKKAVGDMVIIRRPTKAPEKQKELAEKAADDKAKIHEKIGEILKRESISVLNVDDDVHEFENWKVASLKLVWTSKFLSEPIPEMTVEDKQYHLMMHNTAKYTQSESENFVLRQIVDVSFRANLLLQMEAGFKMEMAARAKFTTKKEQQTVAKKLEDIIDVISKAKTNYESALHNYRGARWEHNTLVTYHDKVMREGWIDRQGSEIIRVTMNRTNVHRDNALVFLDRAEKWFAKVDAKYDKLVEFIQEFPRPDEVENEDLIKPGLSAPPDAATVRMVQA